MTNALRHARAAPALAMSYISIVLTITYGYFLFEEVCFLFLLTKPMHIALFSEQEFSDVLVCSERVEESQIWA